jgi:transposase
VLETIDRPAMKALPPTPYEYADWLKARAGVNYHVEVDRHYYGVPHALVRQEIIVRLTATSIQCLFKGRRIAAHVRSYVLDRHTTLAEHMPESHRRRLEWTPGRLLNWGQKIGARTRAVVQWQLESRPHPEQGYRACLGLLNLVKTYGEERLEAACRRALSMGSPTRKRTLAILEAKLEDPEPVPRGRYGRSHRLLLMASMSGEKIPIVEASYMRD